ncbi:MFS transporter, partial [Actinotalea sp. C106]|uniref:MFS transporter n=1 Tax=Actinotalea sp. C106 TaxID=2908644 RepID=UPI002027F4DB
MPARHVPVTTAPTAPARAGRREWMALGVLMLPVLLVSIDNTVLSFAIPQIAAALSPTAAQQLWFVDIYTLVLASLLVTMGTLGDRVGRRRLLLLGAAGFGLASLVAAFASSPEELIAARALKGLFGATLMPSTLSLLRNVFLDHGQRRLAIAIWASAFSAGTALGPMVGGLMLEHFWWGSVFLLNVPLLAVLLVVGPRLLPESRRAGAGRVDLLSVALSVGAMLPFVYGIKGLTTGGVSVTAAGALALGTVVGGVFVHRQLRSTDPLLDVRLFTVRVFSASVAANLMSVFALSGLLFLVSQHLQLVVGLDPIAAGLRLMPGALAAVVMGLVAVALARVAPIRLLIPAGLALSTAGYLVGTTLTASDGGGVVVAAFVLVGAGVGLAETLTNDAILASVPPERAGAASGISETAYELGATLGVATLGGVLSGVYRARVDVPAQVPDAAAASAGETLGGAVAAAAELPARYADVLLGSAREAFTTAA